MVDEVRVWVVMVQERVVGYVPLRPQAWIQINMMCAGGQRVQTHSNGGEDMGSDGMRTSSGACFLRPQAWIQTSMT
jgi:hypothetical protein